VSELERAGLHRLLALATLSPRERRRVWVVLHTHEGVATREIARQLALSPYQVSRIRARFRRGSVTGLIDRSHAGGKRRRLDAGLVAEVLRTVSAPPPRGATRWTIGTLARTLGLSRGTVYQILRANRIAPFASAGR
jgi:transposase